MISIFGIVLIAAAMVSIFRIILIAAAMTRRHENSAHRLASSPTIRDDSFPQMLMLSGCYREMSMQVCKWSPNSNLGYGGRKLGANIRVLCRNYLTVMPTPRIRFLVLELKTLEKSASQASRFRRITNSFLEFVTLC